MQVQVMVRCCGLQSSQVLGVAQLEGYCRYRQLRCSSTGSGGDAEGQAEREDYVVVMLLKLES